MGYFLVMRSFKKAGFKQNPKKKIGETIKKNAECQTGEKLKLSRSNYKYTEILLDPQMSRNQKVYL